VLLENINVLANYQKVGKLFYEKDKNQYGFNYTGDISPISLIMPYKLSTYIWKNHLHPIFDLKRY
jgi:serine/threonine-protein kinase HipA